MRIIAPITPIALIAIAVASALLVPESVAAGGEDAPPPLAWRFERGAVLRYRHSMHQEAAHAPAGRGEAPPVRTAQRMAIDYRLSVLDVDAATRTARILCRYDRVAVDLEQLGIGRVAWDSAKKEDLARAEEPAVRPYARLVGQEFSFLMSPSGDVSDLRGHEKVRAAVLDGLEDDGLARAAFGGAFSDEAVRRQIEQGFAVVPGRAVEAGATWSRAVEQTVPLLGRLRYETAFELRSIEGGAAEISFATKLVRTAPPEAAADPIAARTEVAFEGGEGSGRARIAIAEGRLERSEGTFRMKLVERVLPPIAPGDGAGAASATSEIALRVVVERIAE